jgi:hypothetical protein
MRGMKTTWVSRHLYLPRITTPPPRLGLPSGREPEQRKDQAGSSHMHSFKHGCCRGMLRVQVVQIMGVLSRDEGTR